MEYAVETFSLTKVFSDWWGRVKVCAVEDLNLKIRYNEVFGLLGPNGSGKTTTLKMLLGLLHPTRGKAVCLGGEARDPKISARIGFLPEESYLYRYLSAWETLDFYGRLFGLDRDVRRLRIEALLEMVGLRAVASRPVGTFSKGMARRIGLAQALINDPDLLILDEPTTGLDPIGTRQIKDLILRLAQRGKTVLLCSHLLADVEDVCDRIAILYGGKIQAEGRVDELLKETNKVQITADAISDDAIEQIKQVVRQEKADCEVTSPMNKLESFFIETVAEAERREERTSGAVGTTKLGDFLTAERVSEDVLDKLVSASVSAEGEGQAVKTTEPAAQEPAEPEADEGLLKELTDSAEPEPVSTSTEPTRPPVETRRPVAEEGVREDILEQLAGGEETQAEQKDKPESGDSGDA